jgi:hypothetical protein
LNTCAKISIKITLLVLSLILLVVYAVVLALNDKGNKLGVIVAVSVVIMDLFLGLLFATGLVENPVSMIVLMLVNRFLMVGLGQNYWLYGYMILYVCYACVFVYKIA